MPSEDLSRALGEDNLDARMGMVQRALRQTPATEDFSERLPGLSSPLLVRRLDSGGNQETDSP